MYKIYMLKTAKYQRKKNQRRPKGMGIYHVHELEDSSETNLKIQYSFNQNISCIFCRNWQVDSEFGKARELE